MKSSTARTMINKNMDAQSFLMDARTILIQIDRGISIYIKKLIRVSA